MYLKRHSVAYFFTFLSHAEFVNWYSRPDFNRCFYLKNLISHSIHYNQDIFLDLCKIPNKHLLPNFQLFRSYIPIGFVTINETIGWKCLMRRWHKKAECVIIEDMNCRYYMADYILFIFIPSFSFKNVLWSIRVFEVATACINLSVIALWKIVFLLLLIIREDYMYFSESK